MAITASAGVTILVLSALQLVCCVNSRQTGLWEPRLIEDWTGPGVPGGDAALAYAASKATNIEFLPPQPPESSTPHFVTKQGLVAIILWHIMASMQHDGNAPAGNAPAQEPCLDSRTKATPALYPSHEGRRKLQDMVLYWFAMPSPLMPSNDSRSDGASTSSSGSANAATPDVILCCSLMVSLLCGGMFY